MLALFKKSYFVEFLSALPQKTSKKINQFFGLKQHKTTIKQEVVAGITTFLTMAYIIFVNPQMLTDAGMDYGAVFAATCLAAAFGSLVMGLVANYPIALAPGMGLNAFFTYTVVLQLGYAWETALGAVFLSGLCFVALTAMKIRGWLLEMIPQSLRVAISAGIGLFLALLGLKNAGIIAPSPATLVTMGDLKSWSALMAALSFFIIISLTHRGVKSAVLMSIVVVTVLSLLFGKIQFQGLFSAPPSLMPTLLKMDIQGALEIGMLTIVFSLLFVDLFDTTGTLIAVAQRGQLLDKKGQLPRLTRALFADSSASVLGATLGTSTTTSYVESAAGVSVGGRTGLTAVVVAFCFLASLFIAPIAQIVPAYATSGALFYVAILMLSGLADIRWQDLTEAAPVGVVCITMPLTASIATGIGFGFISYVAIKAFSGKHKDINFGIFLISILFMVKFLYF